MKHVFYLLICLSLAGAVFADTYRDRPWNIDADGDDTYEAFLDSDGNLYISGVFSGGTLAATGDMTVSSNLTVSGDIIGENTETIDNATADDVRITYDGTNAQLGELVLESDAPSADMADDDKITARIRAYDDATNKTDWAWLEFILTDVSDDSRDSKIVLKSLVGGSTNTEVTFEGGTITAGNALAGDGASVTNVSAASLELYSGRYTVAAWTNTLSSGNHTHTFSTVFSTAPISVVVQYAADPGSETNRIYAAYSGWASNQVVVEGDANVEYSGIAIGAK